MFPFGWTHGYQENTTAASHTNVSNKNEFWESLIIFFCHLCAMWDLCSPTRDQTYAPCSGSTESQPLDLQGSAGKVFLAMPVDNMDIKAELVAN